MTLREQLESREREGCRARVQSRSGRRDRRRRAGDRLDDACRRRPRRTAALRAGGLPGHPGRHGEGAGRRRQGQEAGRDRLLRCGPGGGRPLLPVVRGLAPGLVTLAHDGPKAYRDRFWGEAQNTPTRPAAPTSRATPWAGPVAWAQRRRTVPACVRRRARSSRRARIRHASERTNGALRR